MPLPHETAIALGVNFRHCHSRSLMLDRLANPALVKDDRRDFFLNTFKKTPVRDRMPAWQSFLRSELGVSPEAILFAQLQSRLMINMAGGVMENAGLCLDRFGVPYIPGTAVKGCTRRMAIQNLLEAREAKDPPDKLVRLLTDIALVFGWGESDWKTDPDKRGNLKSDFVYAVGKNDWSELMKQTGVHLLGKEPKSAKDFGSFAGAVSFLPAYPWQLPENDLELDVLTCHHPDYYAQKKDARGNLLKPLALDTEEPNPVVFPAVAAGIVFQFAVLPLRGERTSLSQLGKKLHSISHEWLRQSLETFGLGAKTAAGYGWFDASEEFNTAFKNTIEQQAAAEAERTQQQRTAQEHQVREAAEQAATEQRRASLTPDEPWLAQFKGSAETNRREVINKFAFDEEKFWPKAGELADERIQLSLLHFLLKVEPEFLSADRAKTSSKVAKALASLRRKFPEQTK